MIVARSHARPAHPRTGRRHRPNSLETLMIGLLVAAVGDMVLIAILVVRGVNG